MGVYNDLLSQDPAMHRECIVAAHQMMSTPYDRLDEKQAERLVQITRNTMVGVVERRSPMNPFNSPIGRGCQKQPPTNLVADPALRNNPLQGRLLTTFGTTFVLFFIFLQESGTSVSVTQTGSEFHDVRLLPHDHQAKLNVGTRTPDPS